MSPGLGGHAPHGHCGCGDKPQPGVFLSPEPLWAWLRPWGHAVCSGKHRTDERRCCLRASGQRILVREPALRHSDCASRGRLDMSADTFIVTARGVPGIWWVEARDEAPHCKQSICPPKKWPLPVVSKPRSPVPKPARVWCFLGTVCQLSSGEEGSGAHGPAEVEGILRSHGKDKDRGMFGPSRSGEEGVTPTTWAGKRTCQE